MMSKSEFKAWLNEQWLDGKLNHNQVLVITQHSFLNRYIENDMV